MFDHVEFTWKSLKGSIMVSKTPNNRTQWVLLCKAHAIELFGGHLGNKVSRTNNVEMPSILLYEKSLVFTLLKILFTLSFSNSSMFPEYLGITNIINSWHVYEWKLSKSSMHSIWEQNALTIVWNSLITMSSKHDIK